MTHRRITAPRKYMTALEVAFLCVLGGALAGCSQATDRPVAADIMNMPVKADAPSAPAPEVNTVGSVFVGAVQRPNGLWQHETHTIVEEMERGGLLVHRTEYSPPHVDPGGPCDGANGNLFDARSHNWIACLKDGEVLAETTPHAGALSWPLQVGNAWRWMSRWTDHWLQPGFTSVSDQWSDHEVTAYEEITVPAGTFMAYRVEIVGSQCDCYTDTLWFAPEIGQLVKGLWSRNSKNGYGEMAARAWELISFDIK